MQGGGGVLAEACGRNDAETCRAEHARQVASNSTGHWRRTVAGALLRRLPKILAVCRALRVREQPWFDAVLQRWFSYAGIISCGPAVGIFPAKRDEWCHSARQ